MQRLTLPRQALSTADAPATFASINPATGEVLAHIRIDGAAQVDAAVARAREAQRLWAATPGAQRGRGACAECGRSCARAMMSSPA